ncbi:OmpA family protein [Pseudomonas granadensis]|jgi:OmpA-OmpF porin, OOP family|uniref:OmpA family protein n=1 Tax=Pseudomonas granadensis TaxID=1421430 RepID=UPI0019D01856|nr:OmpA family protein [Pseudomonas granadensis]MBN6775461.1 OmpA family protein [Pseudomonas granadensis]MBN6806754.1 OmpA family protein [Pseudomonas granadensis]MBN6833589.1 OmpA family protein [Pseudomonas granadensis]MBN6841000.1 OmpA family protein [Pseudomonas granadensis]MBN6866597.1 OmpA family protein [Pseudomonas granadensis]
MTVFARSVLPVLLLGSLLTGCATHSDGTAPLNQRTWPICSLLGGLVGGGLGAIESAGWAGGGAALGILTGGLICYAQDGDEDSDGVFDRRDRCPDTPENTEVDHRGCPLPVYPAATKAPEPAPQTEVITLSDAGDVLFDFDKSDLTPAATAQLDTLMDKLRNADVVSIKVIGHTDSKGSDAYNQALSERRASSVASYLLSQGLAPNKLTSEGRGESEPVADNATDEGRAQNRRVELHINR